MERLSALEVAQHLLQTECRNKNITMSELGRRIGIQKSTMHNLMQAQNIKTPGFEILEAIADYFGEDIEIFRGFPNYSKNPRLSDEELAVVEALRRLQPELRKSVLEAVMHPENLPDASERQLIKMYRSLNGDGKARILQDSSDMTQLERYKK